MKYMIGFVVALGLVTAAPCEAQRRPKPKVVARGADGGVRAFVAPGGGREGMLGYDSGSGGIRDAE